MVKRFCFKHKRPTDVDVVSKRCQHDECNTRPSFGSDLDMVKRFCFKHKRPTDVDVVSKRCQHDDATRTLALAAIWTW